MIVHDQDSDPARGKTQMDDRNGEIMPPRHPHPCPICNKELQFQPDYMGWCENCQTHFYRREKDPNFDSQGNLFKENHG